MIFSFPIDRERILGQKICLGSVALLGAHEMDTKSMKLISEHACKYVKWYLHKGLVVHMSDLDLLLLKGVVTEDYKADFVFFGIVRDHTAHFVECVIDTAVAPCGESADAFCRFLSVTELCRISSCGY